MATPESSNSAAPAQDTTASHSIVPAPIATNEQHVCFICLQNETDTPNATWVNPCPCSLEAHEGCMLRWIAEMESAPQQSSKGGLKCPACKAPITVEEPYDAFVAARDRLFRRYSRISPWILAGFVGTGTFSAALSYGCTAASIFAGPDVVTRWLEQRQRLPSYLLKLVTLAGIGPGLIIMRWLPSMGAVLLLPFSVVYGATLISSDDLPTWPLSPHWAVTLMPFVQLSYAHVFYDLFGPLERRLNRALRGLPPTEDDAAPRAEAAPAAAGAQPAAGQAHAHDREGADGIWGTVANLGRAVLGLFLGWPIVAPVGVEMEIAENFEFRIGAGGDDEANEDEDEDEDGEVEGEGVQVELEIEYRLGDDPGEHRDQQPEFQPAAEDAAEQPEPEEAEPNQPPQNQNNQNQRRNVAAAGPGEASPFTLIINSIVTSLLFPAISYGMGELVRAAIPKRYLGSWRGRTPHVGLLQEQWRRSLVGGCLFVVLRDVIALYTKYRRVQVKSKRRIKNVERKVQRGTAGSTA